MADTTRAKAKLLENWQVLESINLYHNQSGRDAVYALYLYTEQSRASNSASAFRVRSDWGKRNALLQTTLKPAFPTTYSRAYDIYETLRKEKLREGYQVSSAMAPRLMGNGEQNGSYEILPPFMLRKDNPISAFTCPKCTAIFTREAEYLNHMEWHERQLEAALRETQKRQTSGVREAGLFPCPQCASIFRTAVVLRIHMAQRHGVANVGVGAARGDVPTRVLCPFCNTICADESDFARHYQKAHAGKQVTAARDRGAAMEDEKPSLIRKPTRKIILDD